MKLNGRGDEVRAFAGLFLKSNTRMTIAIYPTIPTLPSTTANAICDFGGAGKQSMLSTVSG